MSLNPSPALAALLSFLFPGLGQIYAGSIRRGLLWALPTLAFIVAVIWLLLGGQNALLQLGFDPQKRLALLVLNIAFFLYHVAAMVDAYQVARMERYHGLGSSRGTPIALAALVALAIVLHGVPEVYGWQVHTGIIKILPGSGDVIPSFSPRPTLPPTEVPSVTPTPIQTATPGTSGTPTGGPTGSVGPSASPRACPPIDVSAWGMATDGRVNLLLVGSDSRSDEGAGTASIRTDSMMLLSIDIASCKVALFSFPRNMRQGEYPAWFHIPLETGQDYPGYLFALWRDAASSPANYLGSEGIGSECQTQFDCARGWRALTGAIQNMAGVPVDAVVAVNLKGFVDVVNNLPGNGVWIDVPYRLQDNAYFNSQQEKMAVDFRPGCQFLKGEEALAFARSRHQDSDYQRARRQQVFLQQVRKQLDPLGLLPHIPALLQVAQQNLFMTLQQSDIPFLAQVAARVDADRLYRFDFAPARMRRLGSMDAMAAKVQDIFSEPEPEPSTKPNQEPCPPRN
jgi:LCP family protein required for cell wall assembly